MTTIDNPLIPVPITPVDASRTPPASGAQPASVRESAPAERGSGAPPSQPAAAELPLGRVALEAFSDERPGSEHLRDSPRRAQWERRAEWLEAEAKAQTDGPSRSRLLLAASEVRALLGAPTEARRLAEQAANLAGAPGLAARQARALAFAQGDVGAVLRSLQEEARAARLPATRAHAYYLNAELLRLKRGEDGESEQRLEAAEQSDPTDHRATLQRLARQLAHTQRPPDVRFRPDEALKSLRQATGQLRQLRGSEAPRLGPHDLAAQPLVETLRALGRGRLSDAADAFGQLEAQPGLNAAVHFLTTLWRVLPKGDADELLKGVQRLAQVHPGRLELRAWAGRALASGSRAALEQALAAADSTASSTEPSALSRLDRAALVALGGAADGQSPGVQSPEAPGSQDPVLRPLALARQRLQGGWNDAPGSIEFALGRALASAAGAPQVEGLLESAPETPWKAALRVERSWQRHDSASLARELAAFFARQPEQPEVHFVAGVLAERARELDLAHEHYRAVLPSPPLREAALRALGDRSRDAAAVLRALSVQAEDGTRRALLLTEALLSMDPEANEFDAVAEEAWCADPELPWAGDLAEVAARMRGDRTRVGHWLARQRERSAGAGDAALCAIREARFLALSDAPAAAEQLRRVERQETPDLALRHQIEALEPGPALERTAFRLRAAALAAPRTRERLLWEAGELAHAQGDDRGAVQALRELSSPLGKLRIEAWAHDPEDLAALSAAGSRELAALEDGAAKTELLERLARLDRARGAPDQALLRLQQLLEQPGLPLDVLRFVEAESMSAGNEALLEESATRLADQLGDGDAYGQVFLAARLRIDRGAFADAARFAERAAAQAAPPLWALRQANAHARLAGDDRLQLVYCRELRERANQPLDAATLGLRAAEAAARLGEVDLALAEVERAIELVPEHVIALSMRAELLHSQAKHADAAEAFETLAATSQCQPRRVEALYRAALSWLDRVGDRGRATAALEEAAAVGLAHAGVRERLRELRPGSTPQNEAPQPRLDPASLSELAQARSLRDAGDAAEARRTLEPLLQREPENAEAQHLSARLLLESGDTAGAERAWRRLEAAPLPRALRLAVLRELGELYAGALSDPEQLRRVYRDLLAEDDDDDGTRRRLVQNLVEAARPPAASSPAASSPAANGAAQALPTPGQEQAALLQEAILHQRELMLRAADDDARRQTLLDLVPLLEHNAEGQREAEALLEQAHRTWPDSPQVLRAQIEHYRRQGNTSTARVLLERSIHGARNAVLAGRLEAGLFRTLELATRLSGDLEAAKLAGAALAGLEGQPLRIAGAGSRAGQQRFDDLIAPAPLSSAFRRLLYGAGAALERAYALDTHSLNLTPMPDNQASQVRIVAGAFGLQEVRVAISDEVGCDCITVFGTPVIVVFGRALLAHENPRVRDFLLLRSLKIAQVNACALSRMSANELWSAVAGFLACFSPPWRAEGQDAQRLVAARNRIRPHVTATLSGELTSMIEALTSNIVPQAAQIGDALGRWASRVALFGVGELNVALESLSASTGARTPMPKEPESRVRWIAGNGPARDLVGYSISDAYTEARRRAGLVTPSR